MHAPFYWRHGDPPDSFDPVATVVRGFTGRMRNIVKPEWRCCSRCGKTIDVGKKCSMLVFAKRGRPDGFFFLHHACLNEDAPLLARVREISSGPVDDRLFKIFWHALFSRTSGVYMAAQLEFATPQ